MQTDQDKIIYYSARDRKIRCNIRCGATGQKAVHIGKPFPMCRNGTLDGTCLGIDATAQDGAAGVVGEKRQMTDHLVYLRQ